MQTTSQPLIRKPNLPYIIVEKGLLGLRKVAHRKAGLTEMCNTDQAKRRHDSDSTEGAALCKHCWPK